jgi:hypothetical protein
MVAPTPATIYQTKPNERQEKYYELMLQCKIAKTEKK